MSTNLVIEMNCWRTFRITMVTKMKDNNRVIKFVFPRLISRILVVTVFALASIGAPLMSDAIAAPQSTYNGINKVETVAEDAGKQLKNSAQQAQNRAARDTDRLQEAAETVGTNLQSTAEDVADNLGDAVSNIKDSFEAEDTTQSMAKKNKTVGLRK